MCEVSGGAYLARQTPVANLNALPARLGSAHSRKRFVSHAVEWCEGDRLWSRDIYHDAVGVPYQADARDDDRRKKKCAQRSMHFITPYQPSLHLSASSKLCYASNLASSPAFTCGHSSRTTENQAVSRRLPSARRMCLRWMPSKVAPIFSIAARECALRASVFSSTPLCALFEGVADQQELCTRIHDPALC